MNKYKQLQQELDQEGITSTILRVAPKRFEVHVNFEIRKRYRLRRSANKYLVRLHAAHCIDPKLYPS